MKLTAKQIEEVEILCDCKEGNFLFPDEHGICEPPSAYAMYISLCEWLRANGMADEVGNVPNPEVCGEDAFDDYWDKIGE